MDNRLISLKLYLDTLGVPAEIETVDDRKRIQKAVYLGQRAGFNLGYRFGWYRMGPYSPELTRDYFELAQALRLGGDEWKGKALRGEITRRLEAARPLLTPPADFPRSAEDWLELLASTDYLLRVSGMTEAEALKRLHDTKPHLSSYADSALQVRAASVLAS